MRASGDLLSVFGPDLDPNHFDTLIVFLKEFNFEKSQQPEKLRGMHVKSEVK